MAYFNYFRVTELPAVTVASSIYAVKGVDSTSVDIYIVGSDTGDVRHVITAAEVDARIAAANLAKTEMITTADINSRDSLTLTQNQLVLVLDASGDSTVTTGKAVYFYTNTDSTWTKIYEFEGMDVALRWSDLSDKPAATVSNIDIAASRGAAHTQTVSAIDLLTATLTGNQTILAGITTDTAGNLIFNNVTLDRKNHMGDAGDPNYVPDW